MSNRYAGAETFEWHEEVCAVPEWFVGRELSQSERMAVHGDADGWEVVRETAKAIRLANATDFGTVRIWVPKSIVVHEDELRRAAAEAADHRAKNDSYYSYLRQLARDNGVKLGSVRKWDKIRARLDEAGVAWLAYRDFQAA